MTNKCKIISQIITLLLYV